MQSCIALLGGRGAHTRLCFGHRLSPPWPGLVHGKQNTFRGMEAAPGGRCVPPCCPVLTTLHVLVLSVLGFSPLRASNPASPSLNVIVKLKTRQSTSPVPRCCIRGALAAKPPLWWSRAHSLVLSVPPQRHLSSCTPCLQHCQQHKLLILQQAREPGLSLSVAVN